MATAAVTLVVAACAPAKPPSPARSSTPAPSAKPIAINPANIKRIVRELPPGYEVTAGIPSGVSPRAIWTLAAGASEVEAKPPRCMALADPGEGRDQSAQGVSGSGSGGVVDVVVVTLPGPVGLDDDLLAACGKWSMVAARATAGVRITDAPRIEGADTVGMVADIRSSVESGSEIDSRAYTFVAYLGNSYAFTTLITDPGSAQPELPPQFASDLLVKTVSTLRG